MVRHYKDLALQKPKSSRAKKSVPEEVKKRKAPVEQTKEKTPSLELEAPKKLEVSKKPEAPEDKGIIIWSPPREQIKTPPTPVIGKGKQVMVEPPRPLKKQKLTPIPE